MINSQTETNVYSLWLKPSGDVYNKLANLISRLSEKYSAPNFEPHVTLSSRVVGPEEEMIAKTSQLTKLIQPYEIKLTTADYFDEYFRCLFVRVKETEEIMNANTKAGEIFAENTVNRHSNARYMPHLSLLYGDFSSQIKEEILKKIGKEFNTNFKVESIYLFSIEGEIKNWHKVKEFTLI